MPQYGNLYGEPLRQLTLADRETGEDIFDNQHLRNSIIDILTTPIGSRVMRRDYGSKIFSAIDRPVNQFFFLRIYSAIAESLDRWEPRIRITAIKLNASALSTGRLYVDLHGIYVLEGNKDFSLQGVELAFFKSNYNQEQVTNG